MSTYACSCVGLLSIGAQFTAATKFWSYCGHTSHRRKRSMHSFPLIVRPNQSSTAFDAKLYWKYSFRVWHVSMKQDRTSFGSIANNIYQNHRPNSAKEIKQKKQMKINVTFEFHVSSSARFGGEGIQRSAGRMATPASCIPEMTVVPLKLADGSDSSPTIFVFPPCTRVKRCGGCCTNNLLSCQPMESNNIIFEVLFNIVWWYFWISHIKHYLIFILNRSINPNIVVAKWNCWIKNWWKLKSTHDANAIVGKERAIARNSNDIIKHSVCAFASISKIKINA